MFTDKQIQEIVDLLVTLDTSTKVYLGCDSKKFKKDGLWFATYATVCIVHKNGRNGCRIFSSITTERDYDEKKNRPSNRLMTEVYKVADAYLQLIPFVNEYDVEVHLDINPDVKYGSSCVANQAAGYLLGVTGVEPKLKPESWASSFGADGIVNGCQLRKIA